MQIHVVSMLLSFAVMWISSLSGRIEVFIISAVLFAISTAYEAQKHHDIKHDFVEVFVALYRSLMHFKTREVKLSMQAISGDRILSLLEPLLKIKPISQLQIRMSASVEQDILQSGVAVNPRLIGARSTAYMLLAAAIVLPISLYLSVSISYAFLAFLFAPIAVLIYPALELKSVASERKKLIEDELPFFASYASVMQTVGRSLYYSITEVAGERIFKVIEREGLMIKRNVEVFAMDQLEAMNNLALNHPNSSFNSFLLGYVSIARSGGDLSRYMELKANEFFNTMRFRMSRYTSHAGTLSESMLIVLLVLPALFVSSAFMMPGNFVGMLGIIGIIVVPLTAVAIIFIANYAQPKSRDAIEHGKYAVVSGIVSAVLLFAIRADPWLILTVSAIAGAGVNMLQTQRQFKQIFSTESALPEFMRDVTEYRKIGYDIASALVKISEERKYNAFFDTIIADVAARIRFGYTFAEAVSAVSIRSWIGKLVFFVLAKVSETGGGTPAVLEYVTNFISQFNEAKKEMLSTVKIHAMMAYSGPLMMVWIGKGSSSILERLGTGVEFLFGSQGALTATPEFLALVNLIIAVSALSMGLLVAKIAYFTVKNTTSILITSLVAILAIYLAPFLPTFV